MKINIISLEDDLISIGFRKVSAYIKKLNPGTTTYYIPGANYRSFKSVLLARLPGPFESESEARRIAEPIADADIVGFSSMSHTACQTRTLIREVRRINPKAFIIWGGIHPIIDPEDAVRCADAICTGEGELAFEEFFDAFRGGRDFTGTRGFWFNRNGQVLRNEFRPLMTPSELDALPLPTYGEGEYIYHSKRGAYTPLTKSGYIKHLGLAYNTVWVIGCPFKCTYCGNTRFIENDRAYARLRHSRPETIVKEIGAARRVHPHITAVVFHDDSFLALPTRTLADFAALYSERVGLPFCIQGLIPNYVRRDKMEILLGAGLNRVRMGIQSGSRRILDFYRRPSPPQTILSAAGILRNYSKYMIPPAYDLITDNPIETRQDVIDTLELVYRLRRPFTFNLYSLSVQPNTEMMKQFEKLGISGQSIAAKNYLNLTPTYANCLLVLLAVWRPPRSVFNCLLKRVKPMGERQPTYPTLLTFLRLLLLSKRAWSHLRVMDFSVITGRTAEMLSRLGIVRWWQRHLVRRFRPAAPLVAASAMARRVPKTRTDNTAEDAGPHSQPVRVGSLQRVAP